MLTNVKKLRHDARRIVCADSEREMRKEEGRKVLRKTNLRKQHTKKKVS